MILGLGVDLIEVARIRAAHERFGDRFLLRFLRPEEIACCRSHKDPFRFLAARFAAKEAVAKAFGSGIGRQLGWQDMEVRCHPGGQPFVVLHGPGQALLQGRGGKGLHLSLSHTAHHAVAVAALEGG